MNYLAMTRSSIGHKHQAFLIARINPEDGTSPRYHCIVALHIRRLRGTLPLRAMIRFIRLLKQPHNAFIVREELRMLERTYQKNYYFGEELSIFERAPYSLFLLESAFLMNFDAEDYVASKGFVLSRCMRSTKGDNDDGITVIDVTNPEDPHYCFIQLNDPRILSAQGYVRGYYPLPSPPATYARDADRSQIPPEGSIKTVTSPEFNQEIDDLISQLWDVKLIEPLMLAETWPHEYRVQEYSTVPSDFINVSPVPSLVQITLKHALINAVENGQLDVLDHLFSHTETRHTLKQMIMEDFDLQFISVPLLSEIVAKELESDSTATIDLSNCMLTSDQIMDILTSHQNKISSLNLSHNLNVTSRTLENLLTNFGNLYRLILLDTGITCDDLVELFKLKPSLFYRLSILIHPALLGEADSRVAWASDFGHWSYHIDQYPFINTNITLPFFSPTRIVQTIMTSFAANRRSGIWGTHFDFTVFFKEAYGAEYRDDSDSNLKHLWSDILVPVCAQDYWDASFLRLRGWVFLWCKPESAFSGEENQGLGGIANNTYAWVRFNAKALNDCEEIRGIENPLQKSWIAVEALGEQLFEVYDLQGFLDACIAEGRPAVPENLRKTALDRLEEWKTVDLKAKPSAVPVQTFRSITSASEVLEFYKTELDSRRYRF